MNCRLNIKNPDYQLSWELGHFGWVQAIFILCSKISPNLACDITLRVHNINDQSTVPPLRSSLALVIALKRPCLLTSFDHSLLNDVFGSGSLWHLENGIGTWVADVMNDKEGHPFPGQFFQTGGWPPARAPRLLPLEHVLSGLTKLTVEIAKNWTIISMINKSKCCVFKILSIFANVLTHYEEEDFFRMWLDILSPI